LVFSPDGLGFYILYLYHIFKKMVLVSCSRDKSIKFWNVKTGELQRTISENLGKVYRMALSADDRTLIIYDSQKTIKVWRLN